MYDMWGQQNGESRLSNDGVPQSKQGRYRNAASYSNFAALTDSVIFSAANNKRQFEASHVCNKQTDVSIFHLFMDLHNFDSCGPSMDLSIHGFAQLR